MTNPPLPSGEDIYNAIMAEIEPELTTDVLPTLEEKYKDESPEERTERFARYEAAFAQYEECYAAYVAELNEAATDMRRSTLTLSEAQSDEGEASAHEALETSIANS